MEEMKMKLRMYRDNLEKIIVNHITSTTDLAWWDIEDIDILHMIEEWKSELKTKGITLVIIEEE
jgi:hypothetical protein